MFRGRLRAAQSPHSRIQSSLDKTCSYSPASDLCRCGNNGSTVLVRRASCDYFPPAAGKLVRQHSIIRLARAKSDADHHVYGRQYALVKAEGFANHPLDAVAIHGSAGRSRCNGKSKPRPFNRIEAHDHREIAVGDTAAAFIDSVELGFMREPLRVSESQHEKFMERCFVEAAVQRICCLDRQALPAFRAAAGQYEATGTRGHASAEAVRALAVQIAGLVSALHVRVLVIRRRWLLSTGNEKGGKVTFGPAECQASSALKNPSRAAVCLVDNSMAIGIDSPLRVPQFP